MAIGILALTVATMTVFQGALSAGPGRLKASSRAIGPHYHQKAKTEFSWTELRFRTTAWVPYIDHLGWYSEPWTGASRTVIPFKKSPNGMYGAGWHNLIESLPPACQHWHCTPCQTDYLPSDAQAAPACASVQAVIELAVLAGCDTLRFIHGRPAAKGPASQLSFRDHPYLGLTAVYEQYTLEQHT